MYSLLNKENYRLTQVCILILIYRIINRGLYKFVVTKFNEFVCLLPKWQVINVSNISLAHLAYLFTYFTLFFATFLHGFVCLLPWILCTVANVWIILISIDHIWVQFYSYACRYNQTSKIIVYFQNIINVYFFPSYKWWVLLIKFIVKLIIYMIKRSTYLWYSEST